MTVFAQVQAAVEQKLGQSGGCHDLDHTLRVIANAEILLRALPQADAQIVRLGAWLHDFARPEEDASHGKINHAERGAEAAQKLLIELGAAPELAQQVSRAVRRHRYRGAEIPETLEEKILYDADKLDSLGAVGVARAFLFAGHTGARLHNSAAEALAGQAYGREDTAYREYLVKLRDLPGKLLTAPGRKIAAQRAKIMADFFAELDQEVFPEKA